MRSLIRNLFYLIKFTFGRSKVYFKGHSKPRFKIFLELIKWWFKEGYFNYMYYAFGMNIKGIDSSSFIGKRTFLRIKEKREVILKTKVGLNRLNYDVITKDKFYFNSILLGNDLPCVKNEALIINNCIIKNGIKYPLKDLSILFHENLVIKNVAIESGEGVIVLEFKNNSYFSDNLIFENLLKTEKFDVGVWVIQKWLSSHRLIQKVNSTALNTTRIVTCLDSNFTPRYIGGFQAFATNSATTDSWSHGSVYVGINVEKECLTRDGILSVEDKRGGIIKYHPDSQIRFEGYHLPYLKETVKLCIKAHQLLYPNFIIGWDVAITVEGPLIVEANEKPGMNVIQIFNGGLNELLQ